MKLLIIFLIVILIPLAFLSMKLLKESSIMYHTKCGNIEKIRQLLSKSANPDKADNEGNIPLLWVSQKENIEILKLLLQSGANTELTNYNGETAIMIACKNGLINTVKVLIEYGANIEATSQDFYSPLLFACEYNHRPVIELLLNNNAKVNTDNSHWPTPLLLGRTLLDNIKFLVSKGAKVNTKDKSGKTPIMVARSRGEFDIIKYLIENGADVNETDTYGRTPIIIATKASDVSLVNYLIGEGAKPIHQTFAKKHNIRFESSGIDSKSKVPNKTIKNQFGMSFVKIHPGSFIMDNLANEYQRYKVSLQYVTLTDEYYIQTKEVTQAQWKALMNYDPPNLWNNDEMPVVYIDYKEIQQFIAKINENDEGYIYRLPTEAEWEYASRAGKPARYLFNYSEEDIAKRVWYKTNSASKLKPVGTKYPNKWGVFDMEGNVAELCQDWYDRVFSDEITFNPKGPAYGTCLVAKGSSYDDDIQDVRLGRRHCVLTGLKTAFIGFRLAMDIREK